MFACLGQHDRGQSRVVKKPKCWCGEINDAYIAYMTPFHALVISSSVTVGEPALDINFKNI